MSELSLTQDEQDVLQELMNIAYGDATAVVAEMLDAFATLSIPNIRLIETSALLHELKGLEGESYFFSTQAFNGMFSGESAFFIDTQSACNLAKHLDLENDEDLDDAILELTNVLTSSLTIRLAQEMNAEIKFSLPSINKLPYNKIQTNKTLQEYSQVIVIDTEINFKDQKINGEIFILTKDGSIKWLKNQLSSILEALM
ncbi:MAG: chemotaxis protein CheX [Helicobacteraceae bacterium]|nr:chemotaxis protein CheX [Candidatus Sulfurimonas ponti]MBL6973358.1 chemotaxis protein CheX [Sulfurimonas sp.]